LYISFGLLYAQSPGDTSYNRGIHLLYTENKPTEALPYFQESFNLQPEIWSRPFMIGYILRNYLKDPVGALPFLQKSTILNLDAEEVPIKEYILCLESVKKYDLAIEENKKYQQTINSKGKSPSSWFQENLAWLYFSKGDRKNALFYAPEGSWVRDQLSPKQISIQWEIQLTQLLESWRIGDGDKLRITIPFTRPYQKLLLVELSESNNLIRFTQVESRGNSFLELEKDPGNSWPSTLKLHLVVEQNADQMIKLPSKLKPSRKGDPQFEWASENRDGLFSLDDPEFINLVQRVTASGKTTAEKINLALSYLRKNYRYGDRVEGSSVKDWLKQGTGDCGYFTYIAIGMLRALKVPVRGVYGIGPWNDPHPALPHSIIEIYDSSTGQWFPHDPQSEQYYGIINPGYVAFTAGNPRQDAAFLNQEGVWEIDSVWFFWNGSGRETIDFEIKNSNSTNISSRSLGVVIDKPNFIKQINSGGPPPVK
jgi:tetratricopeptide (TPR) repeat protein